MMNEENKLAYPKKIDINSFPKEEKRRKRRKKSGFLYKLRRRYKRWQHERKWRKSQKKKNSYPFWDKLLFIILSPIADFKNDLRRRKEIKKTLNLDNRPNIFIRLYRFYRENQEESKESKYLIRKIRKSQKFNLDQDKKAYSLKEELLIIKETWKSLPWNKNRELENMLVFSFTILFAFSLNYLLIQGAKYTMATMFSIPALWHEGRIVFNIPDDSPLWSYSSVISIYLIGPFLVFVLAMLFNQLHSSLKDKSSFVALLYLWLSLTAFLLFFGLFIAGIFTNRGFGYVVGWLFIPKYIEIPFGIFSVFMIWMIGFVAGKKLISFAPSKAFYMSPLPQFIIKTLYIYIPVLISITILLFIGFNNNDFTIKIVYLLLLVMLTPTLKFIPEKI